MNNDWIKYVCKFCDKELTGFKFVPPDCSCEGFIKAKDRWLEEFHSSGEYEPPLTPEEFNAKYPPTFQAERLVKHKDGTHKIKLEARFYSGDQESLSVWIPMGDDDCGLAWDFSQADAKALCDMLKEYLKE